MLVNILRSAGLKKYLYLGGAAALIGGLIFSHIFTYKAGLNADAKADLAMVKQYQNALIEVQGRINEINRKFLKDKNDIIAQYDAIIYGLRDRNSRLSESARVECKGATGAELSREDSEFLARESARADEIRAALEACYSYADSLQKDTN